MIDLTKLDDVNRLGRKAAELEELLGTIDTLTEKHGQIGEAIAANKPVRLRLGMSTWIDLAGPEGAELARTAIRQKLVQLDDKAGELQQEIRELFV